MADEIMTGASDSLRATLLTPPGRGAVAVVALAGIGAAAIVAKHFRSTNGNVPTFPLQRIRFGRWRAGSAAFSESPNNELGEELVVCRRGDEHFEIHCHGGDAASAAILLGLERDGCTIVPWTEWIAADAADPLAVEAQVALAAARTTRIAAILLDQQAGALRRAIDEASRLAEAGDRIAALTIVERLLARAALGLRLTAPFRVVFCGRPNVGKSSLLNAALGYRRAVVFDQPGTTRDVVTAATVVDGWPIELSDTAGLRASDDELETAGIAAARNRLTEADLVVVVIDVTATWTDDDAAILAEHPEAIVVLNKSDATEVFDAARPAGLRTSAVTGLGIDELLKTIVARSVPQPPSPGEAVPFTDRQVQQLREFRASLLA